MLTQNLCVVIEADPMFVVWTYAKTLGTYLRRARVYRRIMLIGHEIYP